MEKRCESQLQTKVQNALNAGDALYYKLCFIICVFNFGLLQCWKL